jgi:hypothetical protein
MDEAASMTANASRDLRKWSEQFWALAISEARKQAEAGRLGGITASANATNATRGAERTVRECSRKLSEGRMEMEETSSQFLQEGKRIAQRIRTASIILLLMAFAVGFLVGAAIFRFVW